MKLTQIFKALMVISIIALTTGLILIIYSTEPTAVRETAIKKSAMLVEVQPVKRGTYTPRISGVGEVQAAQDITLYPRVRGRIVEIGSNFTPGEIVEEGAVLLKIDPADFQNRVKSAQAALIEAQAELDIERGRRDVAQNEYALLGQNLSGHNKALVLRAPQLATAEAKLASAQAMLSQAQLELERTSVIAPFDAQILSREANVGSEVDPGTELARLSGVHEYWVVMSVPISRLEQILFSSGNSPGSLVHLRHRTAWPEGVIRSGTVLQLVGTLDRQTRLARVLVSVADPLNLQTQSDLPQLIIGTLLHTEIQGKPLENVFRIHRDYLREADRVWVNQEGRLQIRETKVAFKDQVYAYISEGLEEGELLITSNLATVVEGISLKIEETESE